MIFYDKKKKSCKINFCISICHKNAGVDFKIHAKSKFAPDIKRVFPHPFVWWNDISTAQGKKWLTQVGGHQYEKCQLPCMFLSFVHFQFRA